MQHLQSNTTLQGGKYRIVGVLGQGGFGITYLARNTVFDVNVAIKEFFMKDENDRDGSLVTMPNSTKTGLFLGQKEKFKKEAKRMFAIKNEHIVAVHDLFEENGTAYYVMDYVDGENLSTRLKRTGKPMLEEEVSKILPQILDALQTVHDAGIWHLDLKPANIMIDKTGQVKLIDFGASKQFNVLKGGATTESVISYTQGFAPFEQMGQNYDKFGPWTDFYALGATLYNLLTNKRPPHPADIFDDVSDDKHLALPMSNVSSEMKRLILWMMKANRMERPQSVDDIVSILFKKDAMLEKHKLEQNSDKTVLSGTHSTDEETIMGRKDVRQNGKIKTDGNVRSEFCDVEMNGHIINKLRLFGGAVQTLVFGSILVAMCSLFFFGLLIMDVGVVAMRYNLLLCICLCGTLYFTYLLFAKKKKKALIFLGILDVLEIIILCAIAKRISGYSILSGYSFRTFPYSQLNGLGWEMRNRGIVSVNVLMQLFTVLHMTLLIGFLFVRIKGSRLWDALH